MKDECHEALNGYRIMWLYVMFDLPVRGKGQQKKAARFRADLLKDGFEMYQFSVYICACRSDEVAETHIRRVRLAVPDGGKVAILKVTDKQFGRTLNIVGNQETPMKRVPEQLEFF